MDTIGHRSSLFILVLPRVLMETLLKKAQQNGGSGTMGNIHYALEQVISSDPTLMADGKIIKNLVIEKSMSMGADFMRLLLTSEEVRSAFFTEVDDVLVFDKTRFQKFVNNKAFLPDSYTSFRNKIGLSDGDKYLADAKSVVLSWPYKDCVLEGGQTKQDRARKEIFWNLEIAPDEVTRLLEPKALTSFEKWDPINEASPSVGALGVFEQRDNLLIKGNNLLALHSLKVTHAGAVDCIYIDPPYNPPSKANTFQYNNRFNHSSWLTFMKNRLEVARELLKPSGSLIVAIDENEFYFLGVLLDELFPEHEIHCITIVHNPRGVQGSNFSYTHEYAFFVIPKGRVTIRPKRIPSKDIDWQPLRNWGSESERTDAKNCFYPVIVSKDGNTILGFGEVTSDSVHPEQTVDRGDHFEVYPIDTKGVERKWRYARQTVEEIKHLLAVKQTKSGFDIMLGKDFETHRTVWQDPRYDANVYGTQVLKNLVPDSEFTFPKSLWTVYDCLDAVVGNNKSAVVLDFFGGSGTTGHAVLELNKNDGGSRRFILTEQMDYVETCTKRRLVEVIKRDKLDASLIYAELANASSYFLERLRLSSTEESIERIRDEAITAGAMRYSVAETELLGSGWSRLAVEERKQVLIDCLDANHLYVNLDDMADGSSGVNSVDISNTKTFYRGFSR